LDDGLKVAGLVTLEELLPDQFIHCQAVIMAGGFGTRLRPLTEKLPKPMLPMGDRPLMEWIVGQMKETGVGCINITTHYLPEKIKEHFGDGSNFGIKINYVSEDQPLGTAGALSLIESPNDPLLVINGDILTKMDFKNLFRYHRENYADLTIAVRQYEIQVPYGILECEGTKVKSIKEKPRLSLLINAGIYLLDPIAYKYIPNGAKFDMTELIQQLIDHGRNVISFPIVEYWTDIGQFADYQRAQEDVKDWRIPY
jgi:NDP-sugar pyrophosphorylase family protein